MLNWIDIRKELPDDEVLAVNVYNEFLVGYCNEPRPGEFVCENEGELMGDITYWISVKELRKSIPKQ